MSRALVYQPTADQDVADISRYIARYNAAAATHFLERFTELTHDLLKFPERGQVEPQDLAGRLRRVIVPRFENYLVYYRVSSDRVTVIHVFHTSRDVPSLLKASGEL